jgi:hypothetical protein
MRRKYGNKKIKVCGLVFDSKKEYRRWRELGLLERAGEITNLRRQVEYILIPEQRGQSAEKYTRGPKKGLCKPGELLERKVTYIADFVYEKAGETVVEDCKGMRTKEYIIKRKLMLYQHGIRIVET